MLLSGGVVTMHTAVTVLEEALFASPRLTAEAGSTFMTLVFYRIRFRHSPNCLPLAGADDMRPRTRTRRGSCGFCSPSRRTKFVSLLFMAHGLNQTGDGFEGQKLTDTEHRVRRICVAAAKGKTDRDLDATNGRVPDAPAPPKMEKNVVINKREEHPPPPAEWQGGGDACKDMATEVPKTDDDLAAPDDQAPDVPARPEAAENDAPNENDQHPLLRAQELHMRKTVGNIAATESKEQGAEEELQEDSRP